MTEPDVCRRSREGLTEYLEGALSPARRQGLEQHLAECATCRAHLDQLRLIIAAAADIPPESMPPSTRATLLRALRDGKQA